ncbi:MAG: hypothetical protein GY950_31510 [bacterium]|nr:hypothetical protein [bacterium]
MINIEAPVFLYEEDDETDVILFLLIMKSRLPEFNKLMMLKLEELKGGLLKDEIAAYMAKKEYYHKILPLQECMNGSDNGGCSRPYWFVLSKFFPDDWGMTKIDPWPPAFQPHKEILPESLFPDITGTAVDPGKVLGLSMTVPELLNRRLNVLWVRYSTNCVMGVVREEVEEWRQVLAGGPKSLDSTDITSTAAHYHLLFHQMGREPELAKSFITRFMSEVQPQLEKKI